MDTSTVVAGGTPGLAAALRHRTAALHARAERSGIVRAILRGTATREGYALLLRNVLPAYTAMEQAIHAQRDEPGFSAYAVPALRRADPLRADLAALAGADWAQALPLLPAGAAYAARIATVNGGRLLAHAYVRYLGDLSGGQVLARLLGKSLGLTADRLAFYAFPGIADLADCKAALRGALTSRETEAAAILTEAEAAFRLNIAVSEAVAEALSPA